MRLTCIIVDDEPALVELMVMYVQQTPCLQLVHHTTSPLEAIEVVQNQPIDLVFLDVEMAELSGLGFIKAVQGKTRIILCTGYAQYALDGFEHEVIDFLLKPVGFERFTRAAQKAQQVIFAAKQALPVKDHLYVISGAKNLHTKICLADIDYIRSLKNYTAFYCGNKKITSRMSLTDVEQQLPAQQFIRAHISFIIPIGKVVSFDSNTIKLKGVTREISIGGTYKQTVFKALKTGI
jgi:two-component system, LytTR family, response regulator